MKTLEVIKTIIAEKVRDKREPRHAMIQEIGARYYQRNGTGAGLDEELAALIKGYQILEHPTINSKAYTVTDL